MALSFYQSRERVRAFDMTPMIDVVLQLIIFFMFTSRFGQLTRTEVELPREKGEIEQIVEVPTIVVDMDASGALRIEARPVSLESIKAVVRREITGAGGRADRIDLLVRADRMAPATHLNTLANELALLGVRNWRLGTVDPAGIGGAE